MPNGLTDKSRYGDNQDDLIFTQDQISLRLRETALRLMASYGLKRTSMQEIAEKSNISRQALYHRFSSKDVLRDAISDWLIHEAISNVLQVWCDEAHLVDNLTQSVFARDRRLFALCHQFPHGGDLIQTSNQITASRIPKIQLEYTNTVLPLVLQCRDIEFSAFGGADNMCRILSEFSLFIMINRHDEETYVEDIKSFCAAIGRSVQI